VKGIYGHPIVVPGLILSFKSELCDLVKQVFNVGRSIPGRHLDDQAQIDITRIEFGSDMVSYTSLPIVWAPISARISFLW
jgi:hypothetical protein